MADAKRTIELVFEGVDKTGAATQAALNNTQKFAGSVQSATQPVADFTVAALKFEAALLASAVAVTAFSVSVAGDFQSALVDLQKVLTDTDSIERYRDLALSLSDTYGVAAVDVLGAITSYKQAGFTAEEAGQLTKSGLDLVIAGSIEAARSADLLVASIKGFGAEASDSAIIVDLLNSVSNEYAATTEQLLEGFSVLSPVAKAAGLSLEETIGVLTPGIEVFQSGSEVANALRTSLLRLVDDSAPVQAGLEALGVSQRDANGELRSARDIYFDVAGALQGVDENQKLYIASQLVGIQRSSQFLAITDGLDKTLRIAGDGFDYLGSAAKEVALQLGTSEKAVDRVKVAFSNLGIIVGEPLLDEFTGAADAITNIFQALGSSVGEGRPLQPLLTYVEQVMGEVEDLFGTIALNLPEALEGVDLSKALFGLDELRAAFAGLFDGLDLSTVGGLQSAIQKAADAFGNLSSFSAGAIDGLEPLVNIASNLLESFSEMDSATARANGEVFGFTTTVNILSGVVANLLPSLETLVTLFIGGKVAGGLIGAFQGGAAALSGGSGLLAFLGKAGLVGAAGAAGVAIGTLINKVAELTTGSSLSDRLSDWLTSFTGLDRQAEQLESSLGALPVSLEEITVSAKRIKPELLVPLEEIEVTAKRVESAFKNQSASLSGVITVYDEATGKIIGYTDGISSANDIMNTVYESSTSAADGIRDLGEAAQGLQLEEKLAIIEARSQVMSAQIAADAEKITAAYESINVAVESTGDSITELFGLLGDDSIRKLDKLDIRAQIEEENIRRQEALDLQKKLTEAQIAEMRARRDALKNGGGIITVNGDGLQPHLEAFMFEILSAIQVRVNAAGEQLLLGI